MSTLCRAERNGRNMQGQTCISPESSQVDFLQTHLSAFLKGGRPPVQFRRSQSQSVTVIISLKRRDHPPSQHLPGMKPLKGGLKKVRKFPIIRKISEIFRINSPFPKLFRIIFLGARPSRSLCGASRAALPGKGVSGETPDTTRETRAIPGQTDAAGQDGSRIHVNTLT